MVIINLEEIKSILYKPHFKIPSTYETDATFKQSQKVITPPSIIETIDSLKKDIEAIKKMIQFVPGEMRDATKSILDLVIFFLILIEDDLNKKPDEEIIITEDEDYIDEVVDDDYDSIFTDNHKPVQIIMSTVSSDKKFNYLYAKNTLDVIRHYVGKSSEILTQYLCKIITNPTSLLFIDKFHTSPLLDYENREAHNILQGLLKSQQSKFSKMRLYNKLYNEIEGLTLLKSIEYSKLSLLRHQKDKPKELYLALKHTQMQASEEQQLKKKHYEFYRYLNGSLITLEECLSLNFTESLAKYQLYVFEEEQKNKKENK